MAGCEWPCGCDDCRAEHESLRKEVESLRAAAPEMLEALRDLAIAVNAAGVPFGTRQQFERARALLARIEGSNS